MTDLVTIAIPVYNRDGYFREALESALQQTTPTRVLVVDNASPDVDFPAILESYACDRLAYHRNERNLGMVDNWNQCIRLCTTPYLLILHDDDKLYVDYVRAFEAVSRPLVDLYYGRALFMDQDGVQLSKDPIGALCHYEDICHWSYNNPVPMGAIFRVSAAIELGGFNKKLAYTPDFDFWFRVVLRGSQRVIPATSGWYREYTSSLRCTSSLEQSGRIFAHARVQYKRNRARLRKKEIPIRPKNVPLWGNLPFRQLAQMEPALTHRQFRYATATCAASQSKTVGGLLVKIFLQVLGVAGARALIHFLKIVSPNRSRIRSSLSDG
ncbi:MAG: hypothetical protein QOE70_993 [Chthoniobacter sp.]|jgi:GT2 family glycosyltransferase|nr:hypothetical protein [Chthoniobacter sp.]